MYFFGFEFDKNRLVNIYKVYITQANLGRSVGVKKCPPLGNNANPDDELEFVLFFSIEYFGIKVDLDGKKKNQPGV